MKHLCLLPALLLAMTLAAPAAAPLPPAIEAALTKEIAAHHAAGVVTLVMQDGKVIHHAATGFADREQRLPMKTDAVFWIASMTKSLAVTAIMTLVDEGKLSLDEPASKWLPELDKVKLANGQPPARPITLRDLMSHTAGIAFPPRKATDGAQSLKSYTTELLRAPLAFEPGSAYEYGFGITVAGRIAEIVSGKSFEVFMQERLLGPLGMKDTTFHPDAKLRARIARTYKTADEGGGLELAYNTFVTSDPAVRRMTEPSGGLFSTALDMAKFYQMILNGGTHDSKRIVSPKAIAEMSRPHQAGGKTLNYGLGWQTGNGEKPAIPGFSKHSFGHGGAFATHGFIDPERQLVTVFMVQNVLVTGSGDVRKAFHNEVNRAPKSSAASPAR
ncbi:MAG: serine hydrolase domain-containing protein [Limisphaerales bacterium]